MEISTYRQKKLFTMLFGTAVLGIWALISFSLQSSNKKMIESTNYLINNLEGKVQKLECKMLELESEKEELVELVRELKSSNACGLVSIPVIYGMKYDEARAILIKEGWIPINQRWQEALGEGGIAEYGNGKVFWERGYHEIQACTAGGMAFCRFRFSEPSGRTLNVVTSGEEDIELDIHAYVDKVWLDKPE